MTQSAYGDAIRQAGQTELAGSMAAPFDSITESPDSDATPPAPAGPVAELIITPSATPVSAIFVPSGENLVEDYGAPATIVLNLTDYDFAAQNPGNTVYLSDAYTNHAYLAGFGNMIVMPDTGPTVNGSADFRSYDVIAGVVDPLAGEFAASATVVGSSGQELGNTVVAGDGINQIALGLGANVMFLSAGDDLIASEGNDTIVGGSGTVNLQVSGNAIAFAGTSAMTVTNAAGTAAVVGSTEANAPPLTVYGGLGQVRAWGSAGGHDVLTGGAAGRNVLVALGPGASLFGGGAGDTIVGAGHDVLVASAGNTTLFGGGAGDAIFAGSAADVIVDGSGADSVTFGHGTAQVFAGAGADGFGFIDSIAGGADTIVGFSTARDTIDLNGFASNAVASILGSATISGGSTLLALPNGAQVTLYDVTGITAANFRT